MDINYARRYWKTGLILMGISIVSSAVSYIFIDLFILVPATSSNPNLVPLGFFIYGNLFQILSDIFFIVFGIMIIRVAVSLDYLKARRAGWPFMATFITLGIADLISAIQSSIKYYKPDSLNQYYSPTIAFHATLYGTLLIAGGILAGTAILLIPGKSRITNFVAPISGMIGGVFIFVGTYSVPGQFNINNYSGPLVFFRRSFLSTTISSFFIPSHFYSIFGFFGSWEFLGLTAGLLFGAALIMQGFNLIRPKTFNLLSLVSLLLFSAGSILLGISILTIKAVNDFSKANPLYDYVNLVFTGHTVLAYLQIFQSLAIITSILLLMGGTLLVTSSFPFFIASYNNKTMRNGEANDVEHEITDDNANALNEIKIELIILKKMLYDEKISENDYNLKKKDVLKKI